MLKPNRLYPVCLIIALFFTLSSSLYAQGEINIDEGKALFNGNCARCHAKDMKTKLAAPALAGVEERWEDYPREDLYAWIRNSQASIASGQPRAVELWNEWKPTIMNNFENLSDAQIENIIGYINAKASGELDGGAAGPKEDPLCAAPLEEDTGGNNTLFFIGVAVVLGILAIILARIISNLNVMARIREGEETVERRTLVDILTSWGVVAFTIFAVVLLVGFSTVNNAIDLGRQQNYAPEQPIKFSHRTHSGCNQIECQYCHDGARRSKHSVIPATNTCMNCHAAITYGSSYGTAELTKIFASAGYNPNTNKYFEDYDNMGSEEVADEFKKWIEAKYREVNATASERDVAKAVEEQWNAIAGHVNKPIEWTRIHNLPDHAYFNHAQHVSVGNIECQSCHGPVEEMEVVKQWSPLSMGWCINCHRQSKVSFDNNAYYLQSYKDYKDELQSGDRAKVTVEEIGGLECQKCHY